MSTEPHPQPRDGLARQTSTQHFHRRWYSKAAPAEEGSDASKGFVAGGFSVTHFPPERIRNFSIIAHVDHGKSTMADRLMELTGAIRKGMQEQYLDKLQVERERGITVKAQTVSLVYRHKGADYLLNLIDTPGHVDFSYEVSRSLAACQGALLLVDASQGIQAQTVANFFLAFDQDLAVVPVLNKIDMATAEPARVAAEMQQAFDIDPASCLLASAKTGRGLEQVLPAVIERIPAPQGREEGRLRMLLFDAYHDEYRGVVCLVEVVDGQLHKGDKVVSASNGEQHDILEVGVLAPEPHATGRLCTGQVGYIITGLKTTKSARVGDTWFLDKQPVPALPGFKPSKSMVFAGIYPVSAADFEQLDHAVERLTLNDASIAFKKENSAALGAGFRCGFLGLLHMEVFHQRLEQEHGASLITTAPTVPYMLEHSDGSKTEIQNPSQFPLGQKLAGVWEPTVVATIVTPSDYVGRIMELCQDRRGDLTEHAVIAANRTLLRYTLPLAELGGDFYDELKSLTSGYASFDYEESEYRKADLVRLDLLLNGEAVDALARVVHRGKAQSMGRRMCAKMKELLGRQLFEVTIQAAANNRIIARETISALRKNVLAKCYGGDVSRKRKLLEKQKEGKKRMRRVGSVDVPQEVFHALMKTN
ncbi:hypothetical protein WJX72_005508 [[Myrmecia] bisecta]|uniref:Translation factor GUF1 homolog, mitochondrial n=1 Tax=[Myrmecia] bisecta TaxID=41462 RepID=A0AAW1PL32_9CHLO